MAIAEKELLEQPLEHEIDPAVQEELLKHPGEWVALTRSMIIAFGKSPEEVLAAAERSGHSQPILYWVPDATVSYFF